MDGLSSFCWEFTVKSRYFPEIMVRKPCCMGSDWRWAPRWASVHLEPQKLFCLQQPPWFRVWILIQTSSVTFSHGANSLFPSIQHFFVAEIMQNKPCPSEKGRLSGCDCLICTEESSWLRHLWKVKHSIKSSSKNYFPVSCTSLCLSTEKHQVPAFTWPVVGKSLQKAI